MKIVSAKTRIMRDEFLAKGIASDTGEIRKTYDLITFRANVTYLPENETQRSHRHTLITEAVHVLAGHLQVQQEGKWEEIAEDQIALFDVNEMHNIRTTKLQESILCPGASKNTTAVAIVYKWIDPYFKINKDEIGFVMENDWFHENYQDDSSDPSTSPVLRLKKPLQEKFWQIIQRSKS